MKIQADQIKLLKVQAQIQYYPELQFFERMYRIAQSAEGFIHWETDRITVVLKDLENFCSWQIAHNAIVYEQDNRDENLEKKQLNENTLLLLDQFESLRLLRLGYRRRYLLPIDLEYSKLVNLFEIKLYSGENEFMNMLPGKIEDILFRVNMAEGKKKFNLTAAPIWKSQIPQMLQINKDRHFSHEGAEKKYAEFLDSLPSIAIFFEMETYEESENPLISIKTPYASYTELSTKNILHFFDNARVETSKTVLSVAQYLLGEATT